MSTHESATDELESEDEYATIQMPKGGVVIYATEDHCRWIQSNTAVDLDELR